MQYRHTYYIKDLVYGASDGLVTTFAVIAGVAGAGLGISTVVIIGYASMFADAFSMAVANYLGTKSECQVISIGGSKCKPGHHYKAAFFTFLAFIIVGQIPLAPYLFFRSAESVFIYSAIATFVAFFVVGALRSVVTKKNLIYAGFEMLLIGGIAAGIAYFVGSFINTLVG